MKEKINIISGEESFQSNNPFSVVIDDENILVPDIKKKILLLYKNIIRKTSDVKFNVNNAVKNEYTVYTVSKGTRDVLEKIRFLPEQVLHKYIVVLHSSTCTTIQQKKHVI